MHTTYSALKELNILVKGNTFYLAVLSPFSALNQCISSTLGFAGGYSYLATSWLRKKDKLNV